MGRKAREDFEGAVTHVYARGNNRRQVFLDDRDRLRYLSMLGDVAEELGWRVLMFCLMGNHVHLVIETPRGGLGRGMAKLQGLYARAYNRRHGRRDHLWGARYGHTTIRDDDHFAWTAGYVALNPVRAGLADVPGAYAWSSHAALTGAQPAPPWLDVARFLELFGGPDPRRGYATLVAALLPRLPVAA